MAIVLAYLASTLLVLLWLMYTIHVTLTENAEDAEGGPRLPRVSDLLKVSAMMYRTAVNACQILCMVGECCDNIESMRL